MVPVEDLFEVHLTVSDLDRAIAFYREVVGLQLAHVVAARQAAFLWIGGARNAMLGLWAAGSGPQRVSLHTALRVSLADVIVAPRVLRTAGVTPLDFDGRPTDLPVVFAWIPAASVFFHDPDGHLLEYIAVIPREPRPEYGIVPWRTWELRCSEHVSGDGSPGSENHRSMESDDARSRSVRKFATGLIQSTPARRCSEGIA